MTKERTSQPEIPVRQNPISPEPEKAPQEPGLDPSKSNPRNPKEDAPPDSC